MLLGEGEGDWGLFDLCYLGRRWGTGNYLIYVTWGGGGDWGLFDLCSILEGKSNWNA